MRTLKLAAAGVVVAGFHIGSAVSPAAAAGDAVAYQINQAHSGAISFAAGFAAPLKQKWVVNLGGPISYPLITKDLVIVTVGNTGNYGTQLYALDRKTGATVWQQAITGTYFWSNAAYDNGKVFVVNEDGLLQSFAAPTGTPGWSVQLPGQYGFSSPPTARNGQVFTGGAGSGGTVYRVDESNGVVQWTASVQNGDNSSPALGDGGVFVSYPCQYYDFAPSNGQLIWHYNGPCEGGGGKTPVYSGKRVYVRDPGNGNQVFNARNGTPLGTFNAQYAPAFFTDSAGNKLEVAFASGTVTCLNLATQTVLWSFAGDGQLSTAPLVVNGQVVEGSGSGELYLLDGDTGSTLWSTNVGASIPSPDEQNVSQPLTGLGAGQGTLVVPAGSQLSAYVPK